MMIRESIISKIKEQSFVTIPVSETSNLYTDLGYDSLNFIVLLTEIETMFSITININEMENCIQVKELIALVRRKIAQEGKKNGQTITAESERLE